MSDKIVPCIWYDGAAEEAATLYTSLLPNSRIDAVMRSPVDTPSGPAGMVLTVEFTLAGHSYLGLNGGPQFPHTEAVSFQIMTDDQTETDRLWYALIADGGRESDCGWLKDRWGLSWQIVPRRLMALVKDPDAARAKRAMAAMMTMRKIDIAALDRAVDGA
ncbi:putative 3-demethylubiquinone-9 3-methyltransferase (glyoxalase superfamily) [Pseudochelatococcus lubricantis]|uniref:3-demethylubiquinone-9 3-methyltransferase (Glyoxalase superfamily) n=1 Tax=Pseudochelatococcus lubricantis TaxID=1538102 RepID=A0ABX0V4D8_9HYPH|nr:VOC family protein [Pseudochelatococcus lubricantis]NIJ59802.1 putative 3-demethylubiquinone-9 3-methyltransferase (glyoxalase superfamily) [Pseudochelatococcus lubricantis]